jgi:DNA-binding NarL/FixJ family response regulator
MENPIRVLVASGPRLMRELILTTFCDQADIEIVDEVPDEADILDKVEKTNPDFVVIAQHTLAERPSICDIVLRARPDVRIITVAPRNNYLVHYWASPDIQSRRVEASEEALLGILRTKPARGVA